jgi:signal transduction histidine kinase
MVAALAALIRFTRRSQKLAELQMDFVAGVSHELRTPLTVIHTAAYNLQRGRVAQNPGQVERYGALIQKESARLTELVEQVLQFAKSKTGRIVQGMEQLSVETVIEGALECSKASIDAARCVVEKKIDADLPDVMGDPSALKRVFENLITNAAKYGSGEHGWIGISAYRAEDGEAPAIDISVADRGPGIPSDEQEHVFDAFFRGRRAIENQVHGTGLGLHLAKGIVDAHEGTIRVKSEPAKGTAFIVRLPAAPVEKHHEFAHTSD